MNLGALIRDPGEAAALPLTRPRALYPFWYTDRDLHVAGGRASHLEALVWRFHCQLAAWMGAE